jgi:serine/threonine protein kinase/Tfp pilus assembly protein PilF
MIGKTISHYRITEQLGQGGMGVVYGAEDITLERHVALKFLPDAVSRNRQVLERFLLEARAAAALSHPNICTIYDISDHQGSPFIVMELLEGQNLMQRIGGKPLDVEAILQVSIQLVDALDAAHSKGIVHRDIKPSNIFVTDSDQAKVLDFGLVKMNISDDAELSQPGKMLKSTVDLGITTPGQALGTVAYMSPEQARGQVIDARTDLFSFGVVLYEMATGQRAFSGDTPAVVFDSILNREPIRPSELNSQMPATLEHIIHKAMEKDRELRYQTAAEIRADLKRLLRDIESGRREGQFWPANIDAIDSLAVLPFVNSSGDSQTEYLSDGVTESIINNLSQLPKLRVVSRNTAFRYRGQEFDLEKVARDLGVRAIVTGRILQAGNTLVVKAEMTDTGNDSQLWGAQYNRRIEDIFAVEQDIASEISDKLRLRLTSTERKRLAKRHTDSTVAYRHYLKGRYHWNKRTEEGLRTAIEYFEKAIQEDDNYALPYTGIADSYHILAYYNAISSREAWLKSKEAARIALEIDDTLAEAHTSQSAASAAFEWDWAAAELGYSRAKELNPNYATTYHWQAFYLLMMDRIEEATASARRALELDPLSLIINTDVGWCLYYARRYDEAIAQYRKTLELDSHFVPAIYDLAQVQVQLGLFEEATRLLEGLPDSAFSGILGHAYGLAGQRDEATRILDELKRRSQGQYVSPIQFALLYTGLGQMDETFFWLGRAYEDHSPIMAYLRVEPWFDPLRSDSRFDDLLLRLNYP